MIIRGIVHQLFILKYFYFIRYYYADLLLGRKNMENAINNIVLMISDVLYKPWIVPLLLLAGGLYFTIRTRFIQISMFKDSIKVVSEKPKSENGISSFGALMVSTASRVGTGNIIGVATAIILGGAGSIFWMWLTAIFGGASAFVESTLAQIYKKKNSDGSSYGGPAYYMRDAIRFKGLGKALGVFFSIIIIFTYAVGYNMLAAYNLQSTFSIFSFYNQNSPKVIGVILAIAFGAIVIGGAKRLSDVTKILVPVMGVIYVGVAFVVILMNIKNVPHMFQLIFANAFDFNAMFGGFTGSCIMFGVKRGLYSNEAGMGSAPNAAATADVSHPVKQGLVQMLSVFIDTLLICSTTAFLCLITDVDPQKYIAGDTANAAGYVQAAIHSTLGNFGPIFIAISMFFFAFTTLIGNYSYCEGCLAFVLKRNLKRQEALVFRCIAIVLIYVGAVSQADLVWNMADMAQGFMVITNMPVILFLGGTAVRCLNDYRKQKHAGLDPHFIASDIGIHDETDFWK